jgi:ADP-heptose:LPS heptosyltransferase
VVDFQGLLKSALVTRAARGGEKIGPSHAREGSRWFYDRVAGRRNKDRHAVDEAFDVLRLFDLPVPETPVFPVTFPSTDKLGAERPRVAFAACSRWPSKNWPPSHFGETGRALQERTGAAIYLVGSSEDRSVCNGIAAQLEGPVMNLCGDTSLVELGSVLAGMDLVISVDSGPMHMAAAAGASVLALFGPTYPLRTGPYGEKHRVLSADMDCRPCRTRVCRQSPSCMEAIRPAEVVDAAVDMLERSEEF